MGSIVHRSVPTNLKWLPNCSHAHALFQDRFKDVQVGSRWFSTLYVQETNWDAQREKACVNTYAHASASQICLQNICGQQQNFPMAGPTFGSKSGPQNGAQAKT